MEPEKSILSPEDDDVKMVVFGSDVKLRDDNVVDGYLVLFGTPDERDFDGDYFTKDTDFDLEPLDSPHEEIIDGKPQMVYAVGKSTTYFDHGMDPSIKRHKLGGGRKYELKMTDVGVWIEAKLKEGERYDEMVKQLMLKRRVGWSSGVPRHLAEKVPTAEGRWVKSWPLGTDASITHRPNDWRNVATLKSLSEALKDLQAHSEVGEEAATEGQAEVENVRQDATENQKDFTPQEGLKMDPKDMIAEVLATLVDSMKMTLSEKEREVVIAKATEQLKGKMGDKQNAPDSEKEEEAMKFVTEENFVKAMSEMVKEQVALRRSLISSAVQNVVKTAAPQPQSMIDNPVQRNDEIKGASAPKVQVFSPWHEFTAEDMSFYATYVGARAAVKRTNAIYDEAFLQELADKTLKGYQARELAADEDMVKGAVSVKSNELNYTSAATAGIDWVPDLWTSQIWRRFRLDNVVAPLFPTIEMPSSTYNLPLESTDPTIYTGVEATDDDQLVFGGTTHPVPESRIATANKQIVAYKLSMRVPFSMEMEEDSIIPFLPQLRAQAQRALMDAIDYVLLNADTTNSTANITYNGSAQVARSKHLIGFDGLRHRALVDNTANAVNGQGLAPTLAKIRETRAKLLNAYAMRLGELVILTNFETYMKLLSLDEFLTMDKAGSIATAMNGQLGMIDGIPVLVSNELPLMDSSGYISSTAGNNTTGMLMVVHRPTNYIGYRRRVTTGLETFGSADAMQIYAHIRFGFVGRDTDNVALLYNIGV